MGLDAWLYCKKYIWNREKVKQDELKELLKEKLGEKSKKEIDEIFDDMKDFELKSLKFEVGYWRKANQIHRWFVENIQDGNDDCNPYSVDTDKLKELLETINQILDEKDKDKQVELAKELLPTQEGFFFGDEKYDKYYFDDLTQTKEILEKLFKILNINSYDLEYSSSW